MILGAAAGRGPSPLRLLAACLGLGCLVIVLHLLRPELLVRLDLAVYDRLLAASSVRPPSGRVTLVEIDERTLAEAGRWPWPRDRVAALLDRVRSLGPVAIGLDVLFAEPDAPGEVSAGPGGPPTVPSGGPPALSTRDAALAAALARGPFVTGYAFTFDRAVDRPCPLRSIGLARTPAAGVVTRVHRAAGVLCSLVQLESAAASSGFLNAAPDVDGTLRRMPQLVEFGGELYPSLALATVRTGLAVQRLVVADPAAGWPAVRLDDREIPLAADGSLLVRFRGPAGTFPRLSAVDVLEDRAPAGALAGRFAFVGVSALGLGDMVATPLGGFLPGVEVQATVADNLLRGDFVRRPPGSTVAELALILAAAVGVAVSVVRLGWSWTLPLSLGVGLLLWLGAAWLIGARGWFVSPLFPTLALAGALGLAGVQRLVAERARADHSTRQLRTAREMVLHALTSLTETRDFETGAHLVRTSRYTRVLCEALASTPKFRDFFTPETIDLIARLAPIHDIGKVGVADRTLRKPGPLSDDERRRDGAAPGLRARRDRADGGAGRRAGRLPPDAGEADRLLAPRAVGRRGLPGGPAGGGDPRRRESGRARGLSTTPSRARACTRAPCRTRRSSRRSSPGGEPTSIPTWSTRSSASRRSGAGSPSTSPTSTTWTTRPRRATATSPCDRRAGMLPACRRFRTGASAPRRGVSALLQ